MTPAEIVARLRALSAEMIEVGTAMDYFGGFDGRMAQRGRELVGAGMIASEWAESIEQGLGHQSPTHEFTGAPLAGRPVE